MEKYVKPLTDHNVDSQFIGVLAAVIAIILTLVLFAIWHRKKSVGNSILLTGLSDAGKTLIYARLLCSKYVKTHTSVKENIGDVIVNNRSLKVVDIPGHERLRYKFFDQFKLSAKGLVYVIDSVTLQRDIRDVADVSSPNERFSSVSHIMSTAKPTAEDSSYNIDIGGMRVKYKDKSETFTEDRLKSKEPIGQFKAWFEEACSTPQIFEPNAMFLATATKDGIPSVRAVLLKGYGSEGFKFYTNYESRKGRELAENPNAAVTFYWEPLRRGVRIEGKVQKTSAEDSDRYFQSRPYSNQIGAVASKQSSLIASRQTLVVKERELIAQFPEGQVKRPAWWGGYIVIPHSIEFWQGQSDRLHDRIRFRRPKPNEKIDNVLVHQGDNGWVYERLSP